MLKQTANGDHVFSLRQSQQLDGVPPRLSYSLGSFKSLLATVAFVQIKPLVVWLVEHIASTLAAVWFSTNPKHEIFKASVWQFYGFGVSVGNRTLRNRRCAHDLSPSGKRPVTLALGI